MPTDKDMCQFTVRELNQSEQQRFAGDMWGVIDPGNSVYSTHLTHPEALAEAKTETLESRFDTETVAAVDAVRAIYALLVTELRSFEDALEKELCALETFDELAAGIKHGEETQKRAAALRSRFVRILDVDRTHRASVLRAVD